MKLTAEQYALEHIARTYSATKGTALLNLPIHHLAERKLWLSQREAGTNEMWQEVNKFGVIFDIPVDKEPSWYPETIFRVKPKTMTYYMAMLEHKHGCVCSWVSKDKSALINNIAMHGHTIIGNIEERELEIDRR